jgi:hypothetical protein
MNKKPIIRIGLLLLVLSFSAAAGLLTVGARLPALTLPDQHGNLRAIGDATVVLFAPDRDAGALANQVLSHTDTDSMAAAGIIYISDISQMPSFVSRMFALPKMRDYPYAVLLGYEASQTAMLPRQAGKVTVLRVQKALIEQVSFADSEQPLAKMIGIDLALLSR